MRNFLIVGLFFVIAGCKSSMITANSPEKYIIENLAEIASEENLNKIYPEAEIVQGASVFEEGTVERAYTILYPDTPNEVLITWKDENRNNLHRIKVDENGSWKSKNGINIGTTYAELVDLNNGPISFYGFGWDYSGAVDWENGAMADSKIRVFLAPKNDPPNKFYGDGKILASEEEVEELELSVKTIMYQEME